MAGIAQYSEGHKCCLWTLQGFTALAMAARRKFILPMPPMINIFDSPKDINFPLKGHLSRSLRLIYILQDDSDNKSCCWELCSGYAMPIFHEDASSCHLNKATQIAQKSGVRSGLHWKGLSWALLFDQTLECCQWIVHGISKRTGSLLTPNHGINSLKKYNAHFALLRRVWTSNQIRSHIPCSLHWLWQPWKSVVFWTVYQGMEMKQTEV